MTFVDTRVRVDVPATSANLGPGFDTCGLALGFYDTIAVEALPSVGVSIDIHGQGADYLPRDERHLVVKALRQAAQEFDLPEFGIRMTAWNRIPQSRGMGSSASAIVSGVSAAAGLAGLDTADREVRDAIFNISAHIEGHPDNVAPAVYGGMTVSWKKNDTFSTVQYNVHESINAWIFVPDFELSTKEAREVLPHDVLFSDALYNVSRVALLPAALERADNDLLFDATQDTLHQQYRAPLMQPSADLVRFFRSRGYAATISGAGPCVLVLHAGDITDTLTNITSQFMDMSHWRMNHLSIDHQGVTVKAE
ncbi:homoserine kinase [Alloscardovia theropitheci]|uniref:Homoserine kinase n=1 Tax=Alloscardovia theropitheci TaxID=2496842 RepID=A0A4R0QXV4_9BIFI|nr:homoserine kinase [Alloscardovia theropitheci]TCD54510.1 homoserine kinase [Alloscardovia theropitheci]